MSRWYNELFEQIELHIEVEQLEKEGYTEDEIIGILSLMDFEQIKPISIKPEIKKPN